MVRDLSSLQAANVLAPICSMVSGRVTLSRVRHPANPTLSMPAPLGSYPRYSPSVRVTVRRLFWGTLFTAEMGIVAVVMPVLSSNAVAAISVTLLEMVTVVRVGRLAKVCSPMDCTQAPVVIVTMLGALVA